jgi:hypothetical protein
MGGGGPIPHQDSITWHDDVLDIKWGENWDTNGNGRVDIGTDNLHGNFDVNRWKIFHYCLFVHTKDGGGLGTSEGPNWGFGDDFVICDANIGGDGWDNDWNWITHEIKETSLFMHELGHNIGLWHPEDDDDVPDLASTAMRSDYVFYTDYHSVEWNQRMDLTLINHGPGVVD